MVRDYNYESEISAIRNRFPSVCYSTLHFLDNAATSQTVDTAIKAVSDYHYNYRSNVHRGGYRIADQAAEIFENARSSVADLIGVEREGISFTSGTTQSLNILAETFKSVPVVIVTELEHHSNILPWLRQGRTVSNGGIVVIPANDDGSVSLEDAFKTIDSVSDVALLSICSVSNLTGIELPWREISEYAKQKGMQVSIDACQSVAHHALDVPTSVDWVSFSGHKMYASTGTGILYSRNNFENVHAPIGGGNPTKVTFDDGYELFSGYHGTEAGTPNVSGVHSLYHACEWIKETTYETIQNCEEDFFKMLKNNHIFTIPQLKLIGPVSARSCYTFVPVGVSPADISSMLAEEDVCVRAGNLCAQPASRKYNPNKTGVLRISSAPYNDEYDCGVLRSQLCRCLKMLGFEDNLLAT